MLTLNTVHVWRIGPAALARLDSPGLPARIAAWRATLSVEERRRADAFNQEQHRREYIVAHAALRHLLARCLGRLPQSVMIASEDGTKPALLREPGLNDEFADVRFNLSHTRGAVLIGLALGRELGIDVERQRPLDELESLARTVMSGEEIMLWKALEERDQLRAFYHLWTRKEAYLKAIGLGLFRDLQAVTVPVSTGLLAADNSELVRDRGRDRDGSGNWRVRDVPVWEGYSASVCWEDAGTVYLMVEDLDLEEIEGF